MMLGPEQSTHIGLPLDSGANSSFCFGRGFTVTAPEFCHCAFIHRVDVPSRVNLLRQRDLGRAHKTFIRYRWHKQARNRTFWATVLILLAAIAPGLVVTWLPGMFR